MKKRRTGLIVLLVCFVVIAALIIKFFLIPINVIPNNYSKVEIRYVIIDGVQYDSKDGFPTDDQAEKITGILKPYKMKQTTERAEDGDYFAPKIFIALRFKNKDGVIVDNRGIWISSNNEAKVRTMPLMDLYCRIQNDEQLYEKIMAVLTEK